MCVRVVVAEEDLEEEEEEVEELEEEEKQDPEQEEEGESQSGFESRSDGEADREDLTPLNEGDNDGELLGNIDGGDQDTNSGSDSHDEDDVDGDRAQLDSEDAFACPDAYEDLADFTAGSHVAQDPDFPDGVGEFEARRDDGGPGDVDAEGIFLNQAMAYSLSTEFRTPPR